jgi:uncharacterized protein (TIRG00374 family)
MDGRRSDLSRSEAKPLEERLEDELIPSVVGEGNGGDDGPSTEEISVFTPRRMVQTLVVVVLLVGAIYFLFPSLVGLEDAIGKLDDADPVWIGVAIAFSAAMFGTYIALFRGIVGGDALPLTWREAYQINMAGLAASRLFSAGGAGGLVLTYWALRRAGMEQRQSARRMIAFLALQYIFYPVAVIVFGVLLRTGVLNGEAPLELTVIPAAIAGIVLIIGLLITLIPRDLERRIASFSRGYRRAKLARRLASIPAAVAEGVRLAFGLIAHPKRGGLAVIGAVGFWATNVGILWASFKAFGVEVPFGVVVQGFFLGMMANLIPFVPGGVGAVDAGMIGAFVLFGLPEETVFVSVLIYRTAAFWLPIPPGIVAFFQLRQTVQRWQRGDRPADRAAPLPSPAPG